MPKKQTDTPKRRTKVKDLSRPEKNLTKEEQKKVKGGALGAPGNFGDTPGLSGGDMVSKMQT